MPKFKESACPEDNGDVCITVMFPNSVEDLLILTQVPRTSIFEGYLQEDNQVPVVMIDTPLTKKRMVIMNGFGFVVFNNEIIELLSLTSIF